MKFLLLFFLLCGIALKSFAQKGVSEKPTPFEQIVAGMKGTDTFMVYSETW